jgi:hypothetical protein
VNKADHLVKQAEQIARSVKSWADLSNALFAPFSGLLTRAYSTPAGRKKFLKTPQYKRINELLHKAMNTFGLVEGATPKKSGRVVVRLPLWLRIALETEADQQGVSLNQLVVAKLAAQLRALTG